MFVHDKSLTRSDALVYSVWVPTSYPIRAAAKMTGLSLDTLRAWERRYKAVVPGRTERGRQYSPADIDRLMLLNQLVQKGHAIGGIAAQTDGQLRDLLSGQARSVEPIREEPIARILSAVDKFDATAASDEVSRLAAMLAPRDLIYQVMIPLMHEVGVRWHAGTLAIAQEHLVSQMFRDVLGSLTRLFRPLRSAMKMIFATPAGESHEFGIQAAAMLASMAGIEPVYLGANLPAREIADAARRTSAQVVVLGVTLPSAATMAEVGAIAAALPKSTQLWIGGAGSAGMDFSSMERQPIVLNDLPSFETLL